MANDVQRMLRKTLASLSSERERIDRQMHALETALGAMNSQGRRAATRVPSRKRRRRRMSAAARKAISQRMKAAWAKRKVGRAGAKAGGKK